MAPTTPAPDTPVTDIGGHLRAHGHAIVADIDLRRFVTELGDEANTP